MTGKGLANLVIAGAAAMQCRAGVLNVPGDYPTIQAAIDAAAAGDEVLLADGVYSGPGNVDLDFAGGSITVRSASGLPSACTIVAQGAGRGFHFHTGESSAAVVADLTITGGLAANGGAILIEAGSSPTFQGCVVDGNSADSGGGASVSGGGSPLFADCTFSGNTAATGGGLRSSFASPLVLGCRFIGNTITNGSGAGFRVEDSSPAVIDCEFIGNVGGIGAGIRNSHSDTLIVGCTFVENVSTAGAGGGLRNDISAPTVVNCLFTGNQAGLGAAVFDAQGGAPRLVNCTIALNQSLAGSAVYDSTSAGAALRNCIVWGNIDDLGGPAIDGPGVTAVAFSDVQGGHPGPGNIDADPLFADAGAWDFHLSPSSPGIDAGHNGWVAGLAGAELDLDGAPRFTAGSDAATGCGVPVVVDLGCFEAPGKPFAVALGDLDGDGAVGVTDLLDLLGAWGSCPGCCLADLNLNGTVGVADLLILLAAWT